jgi:hypothetical protein
MARIIRPDSPARARTSIVAGICTALADLDAPGNPDDLGDRLAYAGLALRELGRSTERTADAWERRGYWLKADQFRREWGWAAQGADAILTPLLQDDLPSAQAAASALLPRLQAVPNASAPRISAIHWAGALTRLKADPRAVQGP